MSFPALPREHLRYVIAPMVGQSDLPFRLLCRRFGATLAYTQMYIAEKLLSDLTYRGAHLQDLQRGATMSLGRPVVAQLARNDPTSVVNAALLLQPYCDAIDLNLGCPQQHALSGHYGSYLVMSKKDWPLVELIISSLSAALSIPVHVKLRLCNQADQTATLAISLSRAGASVIALHARHVSQRHTRRGAAELKWVKEIKQAMLATPGCEHTAVLSNGNVRNFDDCARNVLDTGADGVMVGEAILGKPHLFSGIASLAPIRMARQYLELCVMCSDCVSLPAVKQHLVSFVSWHPSHVRTPRYSAFVSELNQSATLHEVVALIERYDISGIWDNCVLDGS